MVAFFFFNDTATTEIYTLSLHDALPIWRCALDGSGPAGRCPGWLLHRVLVVQQRHQAQAPGAGCQPRSEEHTSELQSQSNLVCRLLLEKKKNIIRRNRHPQQLVRPGLGI